MLYFQNEYIDAATILSKCPVPVSDRNYLYFQALEPNTRISLRTVKDDNDIFKISFNGYDWYDWNSSSEVDGVYDIFDTLTLENVGDYVFIKASNANEFLHNNEDVDVYNKFYTLNGYVSCGGNIMSLVDETCTKNKLLYEQQFVCLFLDCQNLVTAPELPAITVTKYCYDGMFEGCTNLTTAPKILPALSLEDGCYMAMFYNCTNLTITPELPATTLDNNCYNGMFYGCTSLITPPELPATTLADSCYCIMFGGCTNLITPPELPATTLASACYTAMFEGCTNLTTAPKLPATSVYFACYSNMFKNCTSLISGADVQNTTFVDVSVGVFSSMYEGCNSLSCAYAPNVSSWLGSSYENWLNDVAPTGILYAPPGLSIPVGVDGVPSGWTICAHTKTITLSTVGDENLTFTYDDGYGTIQLENNENVQITLTQPDSLSVYTSYITKGIFADGKIISLGSGNTIAYDDIPNNSTITCNDFSQTGQFLKFTAEENTVSIGIVHYGTNTGTTKPKLYTSQTGILWSDWDTISNGGHFMLSPGQSIYIFGWNKDGFSRSLSNRTEFNITGGKVYCEGDVTSLLNAVGGDIDLCDYCFYYLFNGSDALLTPPNLPSTKLNIYCYTRMFNNCTNLLIAPELPARNLAANCYNNMFSDCTNIAIAPELPAKKLADYCYTGMFAGTSITTAPELPATKLNNNCYQNMFRGCTSLINPPELPATSLNNNCYAFMFSQCTDLTKSPKLPATVLADQCYWYMFSGCTSLSIPPKVLPATTLEEQCYEGMFYHCTSLTTAPELPATSLATNSYRYMFQNCSNLNYIKCFANTLSSGSYNWVQGVASAGTFVKAINASLPTGNNGIPEGWSIINNSDLFSFQAGNTSSSIALTTPASLNITLETSSDGVNWSNWTKDSNGVFTTINLQSGETVYIRGNNTRFASSIVSTNSSRFLFTGYTYCRGNIMYLLDKTGQLDSFNGKNYCFANLFSGATTLITPPELPATTLTGSCYNTMFRGCTSLVTAPELPAITLAGYCYQNMFYGCTNLTTAPELPALQLAPSCYDAMFYNCTHLTTAPELPATDLRSACYEDMFHGCTRLTVAPELPSTNMSSLCYAYMFYGCTSLTTAPALPAIKVLTQSYYEMFHGCTHLTTAPELPATTLSTECYSAMFQGCTRLTIAPELPATSLKSGCYQNMFYGCTNLTTAPELPATALTNMCYYQMFRGCSNLNYIKVCALSWNTSYTTSWVNGVSGNGDFYKPSSTTIDSGVNGVPNGWTVHNI